MIGDYSTTDVMLMALRNFTIIGALAFAAGFTMAIVDRVFHD